MQQEHRLINRYFILIWVFAFFLQIGQNIFNNSITLYLNSIGMSTSFAGLLAIPYAGFAILGRFIAGYLADNKSRRITMLLGALSFAVFAFLFTRPYLAIPAALLLFRGLHGFGYATGNTAASTAVVDVTPKKHATLGLGIYWTAQGIALAFGGVLVTALIRNGDDYSLVFATTVTVFLIAAVLAILTNYEKKPGWAIRSTEPQEQVQAAPQEKGIRRFLEFRVIPFAGFFTIFYIGNACMSPFILLFANTRGITHSGLVFTVAAVGMTLSNLFAGRLAEKTGKPALVLAAIYVAYGISIILMGSLTCQFTYFLGGFFFGVSMGAAPIVQNEAVRDLPALRRGAGTSTLFLSIDIGVGVGSAIWGAVISVSGFTATYCLAGATSILAAFLAIIVFAIRDKKKKV